MLLLCTPTSLYSRIIRVVSIELELNLPIEFVGVRSKADKLLRYNPTGKVPTLVLDDGSTLAETRPICEYLECLSNRSLLADIDNNTSRELEGIVSGFVDGLAVWVRELRRHESDQSAEIILQEAARAARCLAYLDNKQWPLQSLSYASICLFCAIDLMSVTVNPEWKNSFRNLHHWYNIHTQQTSFISTQQTHTKGL